MADCRDQSKRKHESTLILGNSAMIEAYKAGIPGNGKPFPDGARIREDPLDVRKAEDQPGDPIVPGALHDIDFMVKDSARFADSGGWGWARSSTTPRPMRSGRQTHPTLRRRSTTQSAGSPAIRSSRTRITFSRPTRSGKDAERRTYNAVNVSIPAAVTVFPGENYQAPRSWAERAYHKLIYFNEADKGGHYAAREQPEIFAAEVRAAFKSLR